MYDIPLIFFFHPTKLSIALSLLEFDGQDHPAPTQSELRLTLEESSTLIEFSSTIKLIIPMIPFLMFLFLCKENKEIQTNICGGWSNSVHHEIYRSPVSGAHIL